MKAKKIILTLAGVATSLFSPLASGNELVLDTPSGENLVIPLRSEDCFLNLIEAITSELELDSDFVEENSSLFSSDEKKFLIEVCLSERGMRAKVSKEKSINRNYSNPLTQQEKDDIGYIVRTLANHNLIEIWGHKANLKKAGDRIDHVHPFRFLECIFTNNELKSCMSTIKGKSWVWDDFLKGLKKSLSQEAKKNNLIQSQIQDFAKHVNISSGAISPSIHSQKWEDLVNILISSVPNHSGGGRYDI